MRTRSETTRRVSAAAACTTALLIATSAAVLANALPTKLSPGDGAVVTIRPIEVSIDTAEKMSDKAGDNDLIVRDAANAQIASEPAAVAASRTHMSVKLPNALPVGTYSVQWFTVSADDGHAASGQWKFTYDPSKPAVAGSQPGAAGPPANEHPDDEAHDDAGDGLIVPLSAATAVIVLLGGGVLLARRRA